MTEIACWAHARCKFFDLHAANQCPIAATALQYIGKLYAAEEQTKHTSPEIRQQLPFKS